MVHILVNTPHLLYWMDQTGLPYTHHSDADSWMLATGRKILCVEILDFSEENFAQIKKWYASCDTMLLFLPEFLFTHWCRHFDLPNVKIFAAGALNFDLEHAGFELLPCFFWISAGFYQDRYQEFDQSWAHGRRDFDILLGRPKPYRQLLYDRFKQGNHVVTYLGGTENQSLDTCGPQQFIWPDLVTAPDHGVFWTADKVSMQGRNIALSQVVPMNIYSQSKFTLVTETQVDNDHSFFTEKVVKPLLAKRIFLVCSGQHYLRNLRHIGFKTFAPVIDESYDEVESLELRISMIEEQMQKLAASDAVQLYESCRPVLEHNQTLLLSTAWQHDLIQRIAKVLG